MFDEVDQQCIEPAGPAVAQIRVDLLLGVLCNQRPGRITLHEERLASGVLQIAFVGTNAERKARAMGSCRQHLTTQANDRAGDQHAKGR